MAQSSASIIRISTPSTEHALIESLRWHPIVPVPAPRQVKKDKFNPTDAVLRYRAFRDEVALRHVTIDRLPAFFMFVLPMFPSWSGAKRTRMRGMPHEQTPDKDNLEKALLDAIYGDDSHIWWTGSLKIWHDSGGILIFDGWPTEFTLPIDVEHYIRQAASQDGPKQLSL